MESTQNEISKLLSEDIDKPVVFEDKKEPVSIKVKYLLNLDEEITPIEEETPVKKSWGGARPGAGRRVGTGTKELMELLDKVIDPEDVTFLLKDMMFKKGNFAALKLYLEYRWGKPKENIDITTNGKDFNIPVINFFNTQS